LQTLAGGLDSPHALEDSFMSQPGILSRSLTTFALLLALAPAAQAEPTRVAWSEAQGTGIEDLSASDDGRWIAFTESGSSEVRFLDVYSWEVVDATAPCGSDSLGGVAITGSDGDYQAFAGCSDGSLVRITLDGWGVLEVGSGGSSGSDSGDTGGGDTSGGWDSAVSLSGASAVIAVETDGTSVYAIAEYDDGNDRVHQVAIDSATESSSGYPSAFGQTGFADSWLGATYMFVSHGNQKVSKVQLSTGSVSVSSENISYDMGDMDAINDNAAFLASDEGAVLKFLPNGGSNNFEITLDQYSSDLVSVESLVLGESGGFLAAYDSGADGGGEVVVYEFEATNQTVGNVELQRFSASAIAEMVIIDGYVVAGGGDGGLQVLTDRPWVEIESVDPSSAISGQEVSVSFSADMDGSWELYLASNDGDSELLNSGDCDAGESTTATFTVGDGFEEGDNALFVLVSADGAAGRDRGIVTVDNPPSKVELNSDGVTFGDSQITVAFEGIDDADLDAYVIYVTITEFDPDDWPETILGGPAFDGDDSVDGGLPIIVSGATAGEDVSRTISPLTNEVTYYVAVRAVDAGSQESAMSNVVSVTPQPTIGAAELAGETGGYCGTRSAWGLAALGLASLLALGRRREASAALVLLLLLASPRAMAAVTEDEHPRANANVELRYGPLFPSSTAVTSVYGSSGHGVLWLEGGVAITRFFELDVGAGFYQELSTKVAINDITYHSGEHTMLTAWPFTGALTGRLDIRHEQLIVPTARVGLDYWLWRENWYVNPDVGGDSELSGGEWGWHYGFGLNLLLDRFDPQRASWLATSSGIDDTYLVVDWRTTTLGAFGTGDGVSLLDGAMITVGLKLDM
jgi:hypothetical protein